MSTIQNKRSTTSGNLPSLSEGEIAVQLADKRILTANTSAVFDAFQNTSSNISITTATGYLKVGNSTVNSYLNSTALGLSNSTVSFILTAPTAAQVTAGNYFPGSNGTWQQVTGGGGGGTPAGSNTQIQYNNSGSFGATSNFTYNSGSNTLSLSGNLVVNADYISVGNTTQNSFVNSSLISISTSTSNLNITSTDVTIPIAATGANVGSTPSSGVKVYGKYKAGRTFAHAIDQSGWDVPMDCHPVHTTTHTIFPNANSLTLVATRCGSTNSAATTNGGGVLAGPVPTNANLYMSQARVLIGANNTANSASFIGCQTSCFWRGNAANSGGFYAVFRFGLEKAVTNTAFFIGFNSSNAAMGNVNPTTVMNLIGFGKDVGQSNLYAISANATVSTNTNLSGMDFTIAQTNWYEGIIYAVPNGGNVYWQLTNITTGAVANGQYGAANLPANNQTLSFKINITNVNQAANTNVGFGGVQIEVPN